MCPCPFCTALAILLTPILFWKKGRKWLNAKIKKHHKNCDVCQKAEHEAHQKNHTPCTCKACHQKKIKSKKKGRKKK